ncbi:hypothetical protein ABPG72_020780 [Tetrahymena utriculariae]
MKQKLLLLLDFAFNISQCLADDSQCTSKKIQYYSQGVCQSCQDNQFISSNTNTNLSCVSSCNEGQFYNITSYCLPCSNNQIPKFNQTACLSKCEDAGQILNLSGKGCQYKENCTSLFKNSTNYCSQCDGKKIPAYKKTACLSQCEDAGQCVSNCLDGLSKNVINYCSQCDVGKVPAYNQTACLSKCEDASQILNLSGKGCQYKENCTSNFYTLNNNKTQCVSNCTNDKQFVDINNFCYTCSGDAQFINYGTKSKNGTCVNSCLDGQYHNLISYCVSCRNQKIPAYIQTVCLNQYENAGQVINLSGKGCYKKENCTSNIFTFIPAYNQTACLSKCEDGSQILNLSGKGCQYKDNCTVPAYNQAVVCLNKQEDAGQILNLSGKGFFYKENCTSNLQTLNNNKTQCVSNCTNDKQFVDINNFCYTCNGYTQYISYDMNCKNGTYVKTCNDGLYHNSTSFCVSYDSGYLPAQNQTICLQSCQKEGKILNITGKSCINKENCISNLFVINNGKTQCRDNFNKEKQFLDSKNFCYSCNEDAKYIIYDYQNKNGTCATNCNNGQYYNSINFCIQCNQTQFVFSNGTPCVNSCEKGELLNQIQNKCIPKNQCQGYISSDGLSCNSQCNQYEFIVQSNNQNYCKICSNYLSIASNQEVKCLNKCSPQEIDYYFTYNQVKYKQCVTPPICKTKNILSASNINTCSDACISPEIDNDSITCSLNCNSGQYQFPKNSTCLSQCQNYISSDNKLCLESCGQILEVVGDNKHCKKCLLNEYFSSSNGKQECVQISNTTESLSQFKNTEDKQQVQQAVSDIFSINQSLLNNISTSQSKQSVVTGSSQLKVLGLASQPGYKFSSILSSSDIQN